MKRLFFFSSLVLSVLSCAQSKVDLSERALELCQYIPDHELNPEARDYMTAEFYDALDEAFEAPVVDYGEIGENEWLFYFVTGNGGSRPDYSVKSVSEPSGDTATATINVKDVWDEETGPEGEGVDYQISMKCVEGKWLLDDFDGKKAECLAYIKEMRAKYGSGELLKYMESEDYFQEYIPDFKERIAAFYEKFGK